MCFAVVESSYFSLDYNLNCSQLPQRVTPIRYLLSFQAMFLAMPSSLAILSNYLIWPSILAIISGIIPGYLLSFLAIQPGYSLVILSDDSS